MAGGYESLVASGDDEKICVSSGTTVLQVDHHVEDRIACIYK